MITTKGLNVLKAFEGCKLTAYKCPAGVLTIGYGATFYDNGKKIQSGDKLTQEQADKLLLFHVQLFEKGLKELIKVKLTNNQWSALLVFCYNVGITAFSNSTLLKKVNQNPNDPAIKLEFLRWVKANGKVMKGLIRRRIAEWECYTTKDEIKPI